MNKIVENQRNIKPNPLISLGYDAAQFRTKIISKSDVCSEKFIAQWDILSGHCDTANIFYSSALCVSAIKNLNFFDETQFFTLWYKPNDNSQKNEDILIALIPFSKMSKYSRWPLPHYQNMQHPNNFLGDPLIWQGYEEIFWNEFLNYCQNNIPNLNFLYLDKLSLDGSIFRAFQTASHKREQRFDIIQKCERAKLDTDKSRDEYYAQNIRKKKRKELQRLKNRLEELGEITFNESLSYLKVDEEVFQWLEDFLTLENAGWKGENGSSLASNNDTASFYWDAMRAAHAKQQLHLSCMRLNGKPLAMLISFIDNKIGFSFKTAFDEDYARYSPGVLLQLENLTLQERHGLNFIDSCAAENHPMIDKIWSERRKIGSVSIALSGAVNSLYFNLVRFAEQQMDKRHKKKDAGDEHATF